MKTLAVVTATGAITSIGLRAIDTAFSHRAAAPGLRQAPLLDITGEPVTMCFQPVLDPLWTGRQRALALGTRALEETLLKLGPGASTMRARLAVCVDEYFAEKSPDGTVAAQELVKDLAAVARRSIPELTVEASVRGSAGPGYLLPSLCEAFEAGAIDAAILGGVHTDYDPGRMAALSTAGRLFRPDNLDGLIPGEAAAFVVLMRPDIVRRFGLRASLAIHSVATSHEKARPDNNESAFQAMGLTAAFRTALSPLSEDNLRAGWVLTDLTFETFRHFELQAATVRTTRFFCEPHHVESPAQRMGHLGTAAMPLHLVLASEAFQRGYAPHPFGVSLAGSDTGERAVILVSAAN